MSTYITTLPTPVYNTPYFPHLQSTLPKDSQGLIKSVEAIAFPGTKLTCVKEEACNALQVTLSEYPSETSLYVDSRFLAPCPPNTPERIKRLPSSEAMLQWMVSLVGTRYFWGGNWAQGIPEMLEMYPNLRSSDDQEDALCKGVDCSGLLFQASQGATPRNTSQLIHYGKEIEVDVFSLKDVQDALEPLDLIVWKGHVLIVLSPQEVIESRLNDGVVITPFHVRYPQILEQLRTQGKTLYLRHP